VWTDLPLPAADPSTALVGPPHLGVAPAKLAFHSLADDLGPTDTNGHPDVYVRDLRTGTTLLASARADGEDSGNSRSRPLSVSPDGTKVAFASYATDLGPHDSDSTELPEAPDLFDIGNEDVYVHDLTSGTTTMVSTNAAGTDSANGSSPAALFSPDGSRLAFVTFATDLGYTDANEGSRGSAEDIYIATLHGADLAVALAADHTEVTTGGTVTYTLDVRNAGPDTSDAATAAVLLPEQSDLVAVVATGATCTSPDPATPHALVCDAGSLAPGEAASATITVTPTSPPDATLSAIALTRSGTLDPAGANNTARVDVAVVQ
jgi:uncharacterized repeat protein (TIGR01451 family)